MFTIRVVIETVKPQNCLTCSNDGHSMLETFVIINGQIPFNKLVEYVLKDLGMPDFVPESKGLIQIKNWKSLAFDQITDNVQQPVKNLLKDISSNATLKILTKKTPTSIKSQIPLVSNGIKSMINPCHNGSQLQINVPDFESNSTSVCTSESPTLRQDAISEHSISDSDNDAKETPPNNFYQNTDSTMKTENNESNNFQTSFFSEFTNNLLNFPSTSSSVSTRNSFSSNMDLIDGTDPLQRNLHNSSGRSRLMFDLITEIPILEQWFEENPHPNWLQIEGYTNTLNEQSYRKNCSTPMTPLNIKIWFKNRRARYKRLNK